MVPVLPTFATAKLGFGMCQSPKRICRLPSTTTALPTRSARRGKLTWRVFPRSSRSGLPWVWWRHPRLEPLT